MPSRLGGWTEMCEVWGVREGWGGRECMPHQKDKFILKWHSNNFIPSQQNASALGGIQQIAASLWSLK